VKSFDFPEFPERYNITRDDLVLEVHIRGNPKPTLQWFKDDAEIFPDERHIFEREPDGVYKLCIHRPDVEDSGKYKCVAKNVGGQAKVQHDVVFKGKKAAIRSTAVGIRHADAKIFRAVSPEEILAEITAAEPETVEPEAEQVVAEAAPTEAAKAV
jgi:Immunoglobulin I-set domain